MEHWALRDINMQVGAGESVALMGANGSGKSTLLRLITGVATPTSGTIQVQGRVGGVVDIGAGFHNDLTGFENIFLHGTLLGLSRAEIRRRLRAIEDFCELGNFLNSPVRHYSWGMFLRLAFSIAVHTEPDVFVVDEALAVGDGYFQWKCIRKIEDMKREGKTILFVSHLPEMAEQVCERALWLHDGVIQVDGPSVQVSAQYNAHLFKELLRGKPRTKLTNLTALLPYSRFGTGVATIQNLEMLSVDGQARRSFVAGHDMLIRFEVEAHEAIVNSAVYLLLERPGHPVAFVDSAERGRIYRWQNGSNAVQIRLSNLNLREGPYYLSVAIGEAGQHENLYDCHQKIYTFTVSGGRSSIPYNRGVVAQAGSICCS